MTLFAEYCLTKIENTNLVECKSDSSGLLQSQL